MGAATEQIGNIFSRISLRRKLTMGGIILLVIGGFCTLFMIGRTTEYQPLFGKLTQEDAAGIVDKLREQRVPFKIEGGGSMILVPAEMVYDVRLSLAGLGLPKGGAVGFEIFDETDFGTTEFVQKLNYQRALQGELARTIKEFSEVADARVMIVMPKESVFIEEAKPPSASVLLKLRGSLSKTKVAAVVNLVASAVEGLTPDLVTVVDTEGHVLSKKTLEDEKAGELADSQSEYKSNFEGNLTRRIQSMLERIVGSGKAIVRVTAEMDFSQVNINEEIYDPDVQVVRSQQTSTEAQEGSKGANTGISSVNPAPGGATAANQSAEKSQRQNQTVNYEINRTVKRTMKPLAEIKRLSVAAVLDGNYTVGTDKDGKQTKTYAARTQAELDQFTNIVKQSMGYSADREDQVTVESMPFAFMEEMSIDAQSGVDWVSLARRYGHLAGYAVLLIIAFVFLVRPMSRLLREVSISAEQHSLPNGTGLAAALPGPESRHALPEPKAIGPRERAVNLTKQDPDMAVDHIRSWLSEAS